MKELAALFLKLGLTAFGGPAAHIAMMEDEVVRRRGWLTRDRFLDYLGATNLIPGPNSTELAMHIGRVRAGWRGLVLAGVCFIVPAALIVGVIAWAYVRFGALPQATRLLHGVKPVVIAVLAQAIVSLGRTAVRSGMLAILGATVAAGALAGVSEVPLILSAGLIALAVGRRASPQSAASPPVVVEAATDSHEAHGADPRLMIVAAPAAAAVAVTPGLGAIFLIFLKTGAVLFGSGYVLVAFLRTDLVERLHWLTEPQLLDAIAIGQVTPGPVLTTATFIGYVLAGPAGAAVATVGIFLPAFILVQASAHLLDRLRGSPRARRFLDGVNVASLAVMLIAALRLTTATLVDLTAVVLTVVSLVLLLRWRVNSAFLVIGGGLVGLLLG
jgi:chromate transporter